MSEVSMLSRFRGALVGVAIGDGMGMPVETMRHEAIMELNGGLGVIGFMNPIQTTFPEVRTLSRAATTDDWQLTAAVARSLIRSKGEFDLSDCTEEHVKEWRRDNRFWGGTSRKAIAEIVEGKREPSTPPVIIPGKSGLGNAIIMKISPLALIGISAKPYWLMKKTWELGCMTHGDPRASIAAYAVATTMQLVLEHGKTPTFPSGHQAFLQWLLSEVEEMEKFRADFSIDNADQISARIARILPTLGDAESVRREIGCGFTSLETAPFAIATYLRHQDDFRTGILEAVNAGGDTDSNASIVGGLIGATVGVRGIPPEWIAECPAKDEAFELADELYACVEKQ